MLEAFTVDASGRLASEAAAGAEMPFELVAERAGGRATLYCYRPLTGEFIRSRLPALAALPSYEPAARALAACEALDVYLSEHGEVKLPSDQRGLCRTAAAVFL